MTQDGPLPDPLVPRPPALIFGVPISDVTLDETMVLIGELVREGRRFGRTHQISTVNVDFLVNALEDGDVAHILQHADVCLPDGMPVVWASQLMKMPLRERVAGSDLLPLLIGASASTGWHVHVFGSTPDVADEARNLLTHRYPGARFSIDPGPMIADVREVDDAVLDSITAIDPDILCVALGNPKQERFIAEHAARLGVPVMIGVGGSLDMLVGKRRRAPSWMRATGLEWIWRACLEPKRLGSRYARDARVFGPAIVRELRASRERRQGAGLNVAVGDRVTVSIVGIRPLSDADWRQAADALLRGRELHVETTATPAPRDDALAQLVGLAAAARRGGGRIRWVDETRPTWMDDIQVAPSVVGASPA